MSDDPYAATPWVAIPAELVAHAMELVGRPDSDTNRRVALLALDNAVEIMVKVFFGQPKELGGLAMRPDKLKELTFWPMLQKLDENVPGFGESGLTVHLLSWYHNVRNELFHQAAGTTAARDTVERFATAVRRLFFVLFGVEAPRPQATLTSTAQGLVLRSEEVDAESRLFDELSLARHQLGPSEAGRVDELRSALARQIGKQDSAVGSGQMIIEIERYLREHIGRTLDDEASDHRTSPSAPGVRLVEQIARVEKALAALYEALYPYTFHASFGSLANDVAPLLSPDVRSRLGSLVALRNQIAHSGPPGNFGPAVLADAQELERQLRHRLATLSRAEIDQWRRSHGLLPPGE